MTPTLCFAARPWRPRSALRFPAPGQPCRSPRSRIHALRARQPRAHAAVVDVAADLDAHPADERGVHRTNVGHAGAVGRSGRPLDAVAHVGRQRRRALDDGRVPREIEPHQPLEVASRSAARPRRRGSGRERRATTGPRSSSRTPSTRHSRNSRRAAASWPPGSISCVRRGVAALRRQLPRRLLGEPR